MWGYCWNVEENHVVNEIIETDSEAALVESKMWGIILTLPSVTSVLENALPGGYLIFLLGSFEKLHV